MFEYSILYYLTPILYIFAFIFFLIKNKNFFCTLFNIYTFITHFGGFIIFQIYPSLSTFIPIPSERSGEYFNPNFYIESFFIFFIGFFIFNFSYFLCSKYILPQSSEIIFIKGNFLSKFDILGYFIFLLITLFVMLYFRVGLPIGDPLNKIAEYSWYFFNSATLIFFSLSIQFLFSLNKSISHLFVASLVIIHGFAGLILGWKNYFIFASLIFFYFLVRYSKNCKNTFSLKRFVLIFIFIVLLTPLFFGVVNNVRQSYNKPFTISSIFKLNTLDFDKLVYIYNRATGISPLFATLAYEDRKRDNGQSFISNIFILGNTHPETYFGCVLLKDRYACPPKITTYAPTSWSVFYIYGGYAGVIIGFFLLGLSLYMSQYLLSFFGDKIRATFYSIFYTVILPAIVFEGTVAFYMKRNFSSFIFTFFIIFIFRFIVQAIITKKNEESFH